MTNLQGKCILIVDDEPLLVETLALFFTINGATTEVAFGGEPAFEMMKRKNYDVVLTDLQMADGDGLSLIKNINTHFANPPLVYLCSGLSEVREIGVNDLKVTGIFEKPFSPKLMLQTIDQALGLLHSTKGKVA